MECKPPNNFSLVNKGLGGTWIPSMLYDDYQTLSR